MGIAYQQTWIYYEENWELIDKKMDSSQLCFSASFAELISGFKLQWSTGPSWHFEMKLVASISPMPAGIEIGPATLVFGYFKNTLCYLGSMLA